MIFDFLFHFISQQMRGTAFASSEVEVLRKPDYKKMEIQPHAVRGSRSALLLISDLLLKISQVSTSQVRSITLLLPNGSFPLVGKDKHYF